MKNVRNLTESEKRIATGAFRSGWFAACTTIAAKVKDPFTAGKLREMASEPPNVEIGGPDDRPPDHETVYAETIPAPHAEEKETGR